VTPKGTNKNAGRVTATAAGAVDLNIFIMKVKAIRPNLPLPPPMPPSRPESSLIIKEGAV
jgi:hypothetical protein